MWFIHYTLLVIASHGTGLSLSLSLPLGGFLFTYSLFLSLSIYSRYHFIFRQSSLTKVSGTRPPVSSSGLSARRRGRPHVTSGYFRVKSGMCFGRAHSRISTRAGTRRFISSVLHPNVCQRPRKFCCNYTSIVLYTSTNACAGFISTMKTIFSFFSQIDQKLVFLFHTGPPREDASPSGKRDRDTVSFSRRTGDSSLRDARENIVSVGRIIVFVSKQSFFLRNLQNQLALHIRSVCN